MVKKLLFYSNIYQYPTSIIEQFLTNLHNLENENELSLIFAIQYEKKALPNSIKELISNLSDERFIFHDMDDSDEGYISPFLFMRSLGWQLDVDYFVMLSPYSKFQSDVSLLEIINRKNFIPNRIRFFPTGHSNKFDIYTLSADNDKFQQYTTSPTFIEMMINPFLNLVMDLEMIDRMSYGISNNAFGCGGDKIRKNYIREFFWKFISSNMELFYTEDGDDTDLEAIFCLEENILGSEDEEVILPLLQSIQCAALVNYIQNHPLKELDDSDLASDEFQDMLIEGINTLLIDLNDAAQKVYPIYAERDSFYITYQNAFEKYKIGKSILLQEELFKDLRIYPWVL